MIILRQREYTSVKRKIGAKITRGRVNIAQWIGDYMMKRGEKNNESALKTISDESPRKHFKEIIKTAHNKYNTRTMNSSNFKLSGSSSIPDTEKFVQKYKNSIESLSPKTKSALKSGQGLILVDDTTKDASIAHELGHIKNSRKSRKYIKRAQDLNTRQRQSRAVATIGIFRKVDRGKHKGNYNEYIKGLENFDLYDTGTGLKEAAKRFRDSTAIMKEEKRATKEGLKTLKSLGANKEEIEKAKKTLENFGKTYRLGRTINVLSPIQNKIQIPNRRRK